MILGGTFMFVKIARQPILQNYRSDSLSVDYNEVHKTPRAFANREKVAITVRCV